MRIFSFTLIFIGFLLIIYNLTLVDFAHPFDGDSAIATIGILAGLCMILLLTILMVSRAIEGKHKKN